MCVCLCGWEKKARWRRCTAIWRHFLTNSLHSSFGFVCLKDCLEALSLWRGPWLLSPQWRMRERGSACSLLSVRVDDGRFAKGPSGVWGVFSHRKRIGEKNFPLTAHPQRTRDVLLDGSLGKNIPSHCLKQRDVRARLAYYRNSFPFRLLSLPSCQSCLRKTGGGGEHETLTSMCLFTRPHRPTGRMNTEPSLKLAKRNNHNVSLEEKTWSISCCSPFVSFTAEF